MWLVRRAVEVVSQKGYRSNWLVRKAVEARGHDPFIGAICEGLRKNVTKLNQRPVLNKSYWKLYLENSEVACKTARDNGSKCRDIIILFHT
jgi:hypothetical protein